VSVTTSVQGHCALRIPRPKVRMHSVRSNRRPGVDGHLLTGMPVSNQGQDNNDLVTNILSGLLAVGLAGMIMDLLAVIFPLLALSCVIAIPLALIWWGLCKCFNGAYWLYDAIADTAPSDNLLTRGGWVICVLYLALWCVRKMMAYLSGRQPVQCQACERMFRLKDMTRIDSGQLLCHKCLDELRSCG